MIELNAGQQIAKKEIQTFLRSTDPEYFEHTLIGFAGTGKTFLLKYILDEFSYRTIVASTVSHSAKNILKESIGDYVECCTTAQLLGLSQEFVNGKEVFRVSKDAKRKFKRRPIDTVMILVIDECSMIDDPARNMIRDNVPRYGGVKIIYSGDSAQLPPVDEDIRTDKDKYRVQKLSPTFSIEHVSVLTEVIRYGALIGTVGKYYRDLISYLDNGGDPVAAINSLYSFLPVWDNGEETVIFTRDVSWFLESAISDFNQNLLGTRIIAYRNETIDTNNAVIHPYFFDEEEKYSVGEYLILNRPYDSENGILHNGTVIKILDKEAVMHDFGVEHPSETGEYGETKTIKMKVWKMKVGVINVTTSTIESESYVYGIHQDSEEFYDEVQQQIIEKAKNIENKIWYNLNTLRSRNIFASKYYCVSCYKAQGQGIENTYIMLSDIMDVSTISLSTQLRSLYVAITRTKRKCIVLY